MGYQEAEYDYTPVSGLWDDVPEGTIAEYMEVGEDPWKYFSPRKGWISYIDAYDAWYGWDGTQWREIGGAGETQPGGASVTLVEKDSDVPSEPVEGEIIIDMRYTIIWGRFWDGLEWKLIGPGDSLRWHDSMDVDWQRGELTAGAAIEDGKLKIQT